MIKFLLKSTSFLFFTLIIYVFLSNPEIIINSVNYSIEIFCTNLLPTLFPFFILVDFLLNYNYINYLKSLIKFKYGYIILLSMISGLPSNAKYLSIFLKEKKITPKDAEILLSVTFFPNPMFVISTVGYLMLGNIKAGISLLLSIYLSNILIYLFYYKHLDSKNDTIKSSKKSFVSVLSSSIKTNAETLLVILGTISFFTITSNIILNYINMPKYLSIVLQGILEMTSGIKNVSNTLLNFETKYILISIFLSFSGISVLMQAISILNEHKLNIKFILKNKLLVVLINLIINYIYIIFFI